MKAKALLAGLFFAALALLPTVGSAEELPLYSRFYTANTNVVSATDAGECLLVAGYIVSSSVADATFTVYVGNPDVFVDSGSYTFATDGTNVVRYPGYRIFANGLRINKSKVDDIELLTVLPPTDGFVRLTYSGSTSRVIRDVESGARIVWTTGSTNTVSAREAYKLLSGAYEADFSVAEW